MTHSKSEQLQDEQLLQAVNKLPAQLTPERDLWQGIERAISTKTQDSPLVVNNLTVTNQAKVISLFNNKTSLAWAASIVIAVLFTWTSIELPQNSETKIDLVASMQLNFEQQKKTMLVSLGQPNLNKLSVNMQAQFTQLTSAQNTVKKALVQDPNNADLLNLLRWTQQQELDLLKQLYRPKWQSI